LLGTVLMDAWFKTFTPKQIFDETKSIEVKPFLGGPAKCR